MTCCHHSSQTSTKSRGSPDRTKSPLAGSLPKKPALTARWPRLVTAAGYRFGSADRPYRRRPGPTSLTGTRRARQLAAACIEEAAIGQPAARLGDNIIQLTPHCHAPIHPAPRPMPHAAMPLAIITGSPTVMIGKRPAARVSDISRPCMLPSCVPAGPGMVAKGSMTVMINGLPAARVGDMTSHLSCVAPIPAPIGEVMPPGCPTVLIGG